jgi:hypothetical protein
MPVGQNPQPKRAGRIICLLSIGFIGIAYDPSGLKFIQLFQQSVAALDLNNLNFLELLQQRPSCNRVVFQALKAKDEFSLPSNVLFAEGRTLLGLDKSRFKFLPIHVDVLAGPTAADATWLLGLVDRLQDDLAEDRRTNGSYSSEREQTGISPNRR